MLKKILLLFLCFILLFSFCSCGKNDKNHKNNDTAQTEVSSPTEPDFFTKWKNKTTEDINIKDEDIHAIEEFQSDKEKLIFTEGEFNNQKGQFFYYIDKTTNNINNYYFQSNIINIEVVQDADKFIYDEKELKKQEEKTLKILNEYKEKNNYDTVYIVEIFHDFTTKTYNPNEISFEKIIENISGINDTIYTYSICFADKNKDEYFIDLRKLDFCNIDIIYYK